MKIDTLLKKDNIFFVEGVKEWAEAVRVSVMPLVKQGYCKKEYIDGIIENTHLYGAYYVLKEGFALLHARSDQGALQTQVSISIADQSIPFGSEDKKAKILFVLVANDANSHISCMQTLASILGEDEKFQQLLQAKESEEVFKIFTNYEQ